MIHHRRQDRGLQVAPFDLRAGLGDGEEVRTEEHPRDAGDGEQALRQRRGGRLLGVLELARALSQDIFAGQELQNLGVGRLFGLDEHAV